MPASLTFSRHKLATFLACQRRFQLLYLLEYPWPPIPLDAAVREAASRGQQFHRLLQRYFLGLPTDEALGDRPALHDWWRTFLREGPNLPPGQRLPEITLTVPVARGLGDGQRLTGRFDLLVVGEEQLHIYDWKTTRPRSEADLRDDWQSRLYLALAVEGGGALLPGGRTITPEQVALTYWFVQDPQQSVTLRYDEPAHRQNWAEIVGLVETIATALEQDEDWPLTADLRVCAGCRYQVLCGRREAVAGLPPEDRSTTKDHEPEAGPAPRLEPDLP